MLQDAFVAIRHGQTLDASEVQLRPNDTHVLATPAGMAARFAEFPGAAAESVRLAETLTFDLTADLGYRYPGSENEDAARRARGDLPRRVRAPLPRRLPPPRRGRRPSGAGACS